MFRDRDQELDRLNRALLEEEEKAGESFYNFEDDEPQSEPGWDDSLDLDALLAQEEPEDDDEDEEYYDDEDYDDEEDYGPGPQSEPTSPLLIAAVILLAFIICLLAWWIFTGGQP